ncbi:unnamed protein product [Brassica oleracea var. botrytis]|uniref:Uncharacterized protein n=1 Tax=Brassica oleracea TaxID=3712 RepID=A0A3P6BG37_BRAOL|nr:unnamed protein product [Brassica oleracea]
MTAKKYPYIKTFPFFYIMYRQMIAISNAENFHLATFYIKSLF